MQAPSLEVLCDSLRDPVVVLDNEETIIHTNRRFKAVTDCSADELLGQHITDLQVFVADDAFEEFHAAISDVRAGRDEERRLELPTTTPLEGTVIAEARITRFMTDEDTTGVVVVLRDTTARKAAEERLQSYTTKVTRLHELATDIVTADTEEAIYQRAVDGAATLVPCDVARLAVANEGHLVPTASSAEESLEVFAPIPLPCGHAGSTYRAGKSLRIDDLTDTRSATTADTAPAASDTQPKEADPEATPSSPNDQPYEEYRSLLTVPLDDHGVLQLLAAEIAAFDDCDEDLTELLANHVTAALNRVTADAAIRRERDRLDEFANLVAHDLRNPLEVAIAGIELTRATHDGDLPPSTGPKPPSNECRRSSMTS